MAKLVKLEAPDSQALYVNSESVRAVLPAGAQSLVVFGEGPGQSVTVKGAPQVVAGKMVG